VVGELVHFMMVLITTWYLLKKCEKRGELEGRPPSHPRS
jgi:hypothetical protein